jgi:hypothetical protein
MREVGGWPVSLMAGSPPPHPTDFTGEIPPISTDDNPGSLIGSRGRHRSLVRDGRQAQPAWAGWSAKHRS